jgi:TetR/AcrR family transcriptional regulator, repressor for neighboring sulfatase
VTKPRTSSQPGPRRPDGAPSGPAEVRAATLEAAADLFATRGVDAVSLRDIAEAANVQLNLISRYIGNREALIAEVFAQASVDLAEAVATHPLSGQGFTADTPMGRWVRIAAVMAISGRPLPVTPDEANPVTAMAHTLAEGYGVDDESARVRAAQITAAALGWRIFEDYLVQAAGLDEIGLETLREDLAHSARRLGATAFPSPPDPPGRTPKR